MIKNKVKVDSIMGMDHFIKDNGLKVGNMEEESLEIEMARYMKVDMNMVN
jgi:hypothetical protein